VRFAAVQYGRDWRLYIMFRSTILPCSTLEEACMPAWKRKSEQRAVRSRSSRMTELKLWREWSVVARRSRKALRESLRSSLEFNAKTDMQRCKHPLPLALAVAVQLCSYMRQQQTHILYIVLSDSLIPVLANLCSYSVLFTSITASVHALTTYFPCTASSSIHQARLPAPAQRYTSFSFLCSNNLEHNINTTLVRTILPAWSIENLLDHLLVWTW
jgi:hypothetical protein